MKKYHFECNECKVGDSGGGIGGWSVHTELWEKYGNGKGFLCIKCFEKRLGRQLEAIDFADTMDNYTNYDVRLIMGIDNPSVKRYKLKKDISRPNAFIPAGTVSAPCGKSHSFSCFKDSSTRYEVYRQQEIDENPDWFEQVPSFWEMKQSISEVCQFPKQNNKDENAYSFLETTRPMKTPDRSACFTHEDMREAFNAGRSGHGEIVTTRDGYASRCSCINHRYATFEDYMKSKAPLKTP